MNSGAREEKKASRATSAEWDSEREVALSRAPSKCQLSQVKSEFADMDGRIWYNAHTVNITGAWTRFIEEMMRHEAKGMIAYWVKLLPGTKSEAAPQPGVTVKSERGNIRVYVHSTRFPPGRRGPGTGLCICSRLMAPPIAKK